MKNVLITGGAGFIGSSLVDELARNECNVVILDNFDHFYDPARKRKNIKAACALPQVTLYEGDIRDEALVDRIFREHEIEIVVHLAARAGVRTSLEEPVEYESVNISGTVVLYECARRYNIERFIFSSSSSVYGSDTEPPFQETAPCRHPSSIYAATKMSGELIGYAYHSLYQLPVINLRFFTVYGPRQRPEMAIHKFFRKISHDEEIPVFGGGQLYRDFTYIDDIVKGIISAIHLKTVNFEIFNLGTTHMILLEDLITDLTHTFWSSIQRA